MTLWAPHPLDLIPKLLRIRERSRADVHPRFSALREMRKLVVQPSLERRSRHPDSLRNRLQTRPLPHKPLDGLRLPVREHDLPEPHKPAVSTADDKIPPVDMP